MGTAIAIPISTILIKSLARSPMIPVSLQDCYSMSGAVVGLFIVKDCHLLSKLAICYRALSYIIFDLIQFLDIYVWFRPT